jgi:hypothetical protein
VASVHNYFPVLASHLGIHSSYIVHSWFV